MTNYVFALTFSGGLSVERTVTAADRRAAGARLRQQLTEAEVDALESIECVEQVEVADEC
jgi:hypothetical protein